METPERREPDFTEDDPRDTDVGEEGYPEEQPEEITDD